MFFGSIEGSDYNMEHTVVIRTHDGPKNRVFPYVKTPFSVLITVFPRNGSERCSKVRQGVARCIRNSGPRSKDNGSTPWLKNDQDIQSIYQVQYTIPTKKTRNKKRRLRFTGRQEIRETLYSR